jgi:hypothetical protein
VVEYGEIQFTEAPEVLRGMGLGYLKKTEKALEELVERNSPRSGSLYLPGCVRGAGWRGG